MLGAPLWHLKTYLGGPIATVFREPTAAVCGPGGQPVVESMAVDNTNISMKSYGGIGGTSEREGKERMREPRSAWLRGEGLDGRDRQMNGPTRRTECAKCEKAAKKPIRSEGKQMVEPDRGDLSFPLLF